MKRAPLLILFFIFSFFASSKVQAEYWRKIENLPKEARNVQWLDVFFLNSNYGWICGRSYNDNFGRVLRTVNGGATWQVSLVAGWFLESVHFVDTQNGFCSGPSGVFKSTDGGVTWQPISYLNSLVASYSIDTWGCFMLNTDTIYVAGGGCLPPSTTSLDDHRIIWRSTDGGVNWTPTSLSNIPLDGSTDYFSGLTDVMVYPNGLGYASSSGLIWKTNNFGDTWELASRSGQNLSWQEEITNYPGTNSVLVPFSGIDCAGGLVNVGGMRFSTDITNPMSWRETVTSGPMYGSFLLGPAEGWACGTGRGIFYTNDGGISWALKNCGIQAGDNLDDIFFITPENGWVVGDNIYRLAPSELFVSKDTVDFGDSCTAQNLYDTLFVQNMNFNRSILDISILQNSPYFTILAPEYLYFPVPACHVTRIIVKYSPKSFGEHNFSIVVKMTPDNENITHSDTVFYKGALKEFTAWAEQDTIDFGDVPVKTSRYRNLNWHSKETDTILKYRCSVNNLNITDVTMKKPFVITNAEASSIQFKISPQDTGVTYVSYTFIFSTCDEERTVVLKVRGISPIINTNDYEDISISCINDTTIKIPIYNSGNASLEIYSINLVDSAGLFSQDLASKAHILGFTSQKTLPLSIEALKSDTLLLRLTSTEIDTLKGNIVIVNNDNKRPSSIHPNTVKFTAIFYKTLLDKDTINIDFGNVCVGSSALETRELTNLSNLTVSFKNTKQENNIFEIIEAPKNANFKQKVHYKVRFSPNKIGRFNDTIEVDVSPCNTKLVLILKGCGVLNNVEIEPEKITDKLNINIAKNYEVAVKSNSIQDIKISEAKIVPILPETEISFITDFPLNLISKHTEKIELTIESNSEIHYSGNLILYLESECFDTIYVPIDIEFINNNLEYTDTKGDIAYKFNHNLTCENTKSYDTIFVSNTQAYTFEEVKFDKNTPEYNIISLPNLPMKVEAESKIKIVTSFEATSEGNFSNSLIFRMLDSATQETRFDTIYFHNEYRRSNITLLDTILDFGLVETCDLPKTLYIRFRNSGTLSDTLYFDRDVLPNYYKINVNSLAILPETKDSVEVQFYPELVESLPNKSFIPLKIRSTVCPKNFTTNIKSHTNSIELKIENKNLDFGEVWINTKETLELEIKNTSLFDIEIIEIKLEPDNNFSIDTTLPLAIKSQSSIKIPVSFMADKSDFYTAKVFLSAKRSCNLNDTLNLAASVPVEKYFATLKFDSTSALPGKQTTLSAFIVSPVTELLAKEINFTIDMNNYLFFPKKMFLIDKNIKEEIEFNFSLADGISSKISEEHANSILSTKGKFLEIEGLALLYNPNSTKISFKNFDITTDKLYEITQENGEFKLSDYCGNSVGLYGRINFLAEITPNYSNVISDNFDINFSATQNSFVNIKIMDLTGKCVFFKTLSLKKGENNFIFPMDKISTGTYNLQINNAFYLIVSDKLLIVK